MKLSTKPTHAKSSATMAKTETVVVVSTAVGWLVGSWQPMLTQETKTKSKGSQTDSFKKDL